MLAHRMTLKQQSTISSMSCRTFAVLTEVRETLRMNHAIGEAMEDVREGRTYGGEEFLAKVQERWPRKSNQLLLHRQ